MSQLMGTTGALGKRKIPLTQEADVSVQPQLNGGPVLCAGATSAAEPTFESKHSPDPSAVPSQAGRMVVPEGGKPCPDPLSSSLGLLGSRLQHAVVKGE